MDRMNKKTTVIMFIATFSVAGLGALTMGFAAYALLLHHEDYENCMKSLKRDPLNA